MSQICTDCLSNAHADDADGDDFFLLVNLVRTDVTDLHRLFVKNADAMTRRLMIF